MGYDVDSLLPSTVPLDKLREVVELLGYHRAQGRPSHALGAYVWYDAIDYRSSSPVSLLISRDAERRIVIDIHTQIFASYWDLTQLNKTARTLRSLFGGTFSTSSGKCRYLPVPEGPPSPAASGCNRAYGRFGIALIRSRNMLDSIRFSRPTETTGLEVVDGLNPRIMANNLIVPYLVAILEDYFKSTFVALFKYSSRDIKRKFLKDAAKLPADRLVDVSDSVSSIEDALVEGLPFQRISKVSEHFKALDARLDLAGVLRKPYLRRAESLYDRVEALTMRRHALIHAAELDLTLEDAHLSRAVDDLREAVVRCYARITHLYGWEPDNSWSSRASSWRRSKASAARTGQVDGALPNAPTFRSASRS